MVTKSSPGLHGAGAGHARARALCSFGARRDAVARRQTPARALASHFLAAKQVASPVGSHFLPMKQLAAPMGAHFLPVKQLAVPKGAHSLPTKQPGRHWARAKALGARQSTVRRAAVWSGAVSQLLEPRPNVASSSIVKLVADELLQPRARRHLVVADLPGQFGRSREKPSPSQPSTPPSRKATGVPLCASSPATVLESAPPRQ